MIILIAVVFALGLLYFWLLGHWFARVLVFLPLGAFSALLGIATANQGHPPNPVVGVILGMILAGLAWLFASLPIYIWRWRVRAAARAWAKS